MSNKDCPKCPYESLVLFLAVAAAFFVPIKLSFTYAVLAPLTLIWLIKNRGSFKSAINQVPAPLYVPLLCWLGAAATSAFFGVDPARSLTKLASFLFIALVIPVFCSAGKRFGVITVLTPLLLGESVTALYAVFEPLLPQTLDKIFPGYMTTAGQLAIALAAGFGTCIYLKHFTAGLKQNASALLPAALNLAFASCAGFSIRAKDPGAFFLWSKFGLGVSITGTCIFLFTQRKKNGFIFLLLTTICIPFITAALLIELKRGPWLGAAVGILLLLSTISRRYVLPILGAVIVVCVAVTPVRHRLYNSYSDFVISGGRLVMWEIGAELAAKYPLGIGFSNSKFMRKVDPDIPPSHSHFHSNIVNVLAETGWLGLLVYFWWIFSVLQTGLKFSGGDRRLLLPNSLVSAFIVWQTAGLVEYNFGDSEVLIMSLMITGLLAAALNDRASERGAS